jgi:TatD DNase family protein
MIGLQLSLAKKYHLPLFLHSRAAHADFVEILRSEGFGDDGGRTTGANGGVVHSFTGTIQEAAELVSPTLESLYEREMIMI